MPENTGGNTNNKLELLVGIVADTEGSKKSIQEQLTTLATELKGLDNIKLGISKDDIKALQDIAKIDFSKLKGIGDGVGEGLGAASQKVKKFAEVTKQQLDEAMKIAKLEIDGSKAVKSVDEIEKRIKQMDKNATVELVKIPDSAGNEVDKLVAKYKYAGKEINTVFEQVRLVGGGASGEDILAFMPQRIRDIDANLKTATQSMNAFYKEVEKAEHAGKITTEQAKELVVEMKKIETSSKAMDKMTLNADSEKELAARKGISNEIEKASKQLDQQVKANKEATAEEARQLKLQKESEAVQEKIRKTILEITRMQGKNPQAFKGDPKVEGMLADLKKIDPAAQGAANSVKKISDSFDTMKARATTAGRESMTVMDSFRVAMEKFPIWMAASTAFYGTTRSIKAAIQEIVELDSQITVLRRVAGDGINVNEVMKESIKLASELGNQIADVNEGFIAFARQGYRGEDLSYMAEYATLLGNISEMDVEESASILTAALKGFNLEAKEAARVVDALNEVDNNYAITSQILAQAIQRSAGAARTYGVTLEETIGYTTAIGQVTRESGSIIGNSLKSIYSRITSLPAAVDALGQIGITVKDSAGEMREVSGILDDLGAQWHDLSAEQQQNLGLQIAGRFQLSRFLILMNDYDEALRATNTAENSAGSGYRENAEYLKSYEAQINKLKNAWTEAVIAMRDSGLGDAMINGLAIGLKFMNMLTSIIDKIGVMPVAILGASTAILLLSTRTKEFAMSLGMSARALVTQGIALNKNKADTAANAMALTTLTAANTTASTAIKGVNVSMIAGSAATGTATVATTGLGVAVKGLAASLATMAIPVAAIMALGYALTWVVGKFMDASAAAKELDEIVKDSMEKGVAAVSTNTEEVNGLLLKYKELSELDDVGGLSAEQDQEYLDIQNQLAELFPTIVQSIDDKGNAHLKSSEEIEKEQAKMKDLLKTEQELILTRAQANYQENIDNIKKYSDAIEDAEGKMAAAKAKMDNGISKGVRDQGERQLAEATAEKINLEMKLALENGNLSKNMADAMGAEIGLLPSKLAPAIEKSMTDITDALKLDTSKLDSKEIEKLQQDLAKSTQDLDAAFKSKNVEEYDKALEVLQKTLKDNKIDVDLTGLAYDEMNEKTDTIIKNAKESGKAVGEFGDEIEGVEGQVAGLNEKLGESADALECMTGMSTSVIEEVDELLFVYDELAEQTGLTAEQTALLEEATARLSQVYPELAGESFHLIGVYENLIDKKHKTAEESALLLDAEQRLLKLHPSLMDSDINRANVMEIVMEKIREETRLNDIYLAAMKAKRDGSLTAEEELTLGQLQNINARITNINAEIKALDQLGKHYNSISAMNKFAQNAALAAGQPLLAGALAGFDIGQRAIIESQEARLAGATAERVRVTDILSNSTEVLNNTSTQGNKELAKAANEREKEEKKASAARDKAAKSQKNLNDKTKLAIYLTDSYAEALRKVDLEMGKLNETQDKYNKWDKEYIAAQKQKIALLETQKALHQSQAADLQSQISSGNHVNTGITTVSGAQGGSPQATVWNFFKNKGFSDNAVAGIMGNIQQESGFNSKAINKTSGASGIFQWLGSRKTELMNYAKSVGKSWTDLTTQLEFAWKELNGKEKRAMNSLKGTKTASQFAVDFEATYERSGGSGNAKRKSYANQALSNYGGSGNAQATTQAVSSAVTQSMSDYYLKGNFRANQGIQYRGKQLHTGIDLITKAGTDIKSVKSGVVKGKGKHATAGNYIDITQSDGTVARYLHMQNPSALVVGQSINAGDSVGKVGSTGRSSTPHLHLEIRDPKQKAQKGDLSPGYGLALDPVKYLRNQVTPVQMSNGQVVSQEQAQFQQNTDGLKSEKDKAAQAVLAANKNIRAARRDLWEAETAGFRNNISKSDEKLQNGENRLKKLSASSKEYRAELEDQKRVLKDKQKYNEQEVTYWKNLQKNGKLSSAELELVRAKLHQLGLEKNEIKFEIDDRALAQLESYAQRFEERRGQIAREYEYEATKLEGLTHGSEQYFKTLAKIASLTDRNLGVDEHESQKLRAAIKSGELYGDSLKAAKERLEELRNSIAALHLEQQQNILIEVEQKGIFYDNKRGKREQERAYEIAKLKDVDIASERYGKTLQKISALMKDQQKTNKEELAYLEKVLISKKMNAAVTKEVTDRIWELKISMKELNSEIQNLDLERLDVLMRVHERAISDLSYEYQRSQAIMKLYEEGSAEYNAEIVKQIGLLGNHANAVKAQRDALQNEILTMNLSAEAIEEKKKQIQSLSLEYYGLMGTLKDTEKSLEAAQKKMAEDAADKLISAYKSYLNEKRDMHLKSIDEETKAENKRHKAIMDNLKDELDAFRKIVQEKIDSIDRQEDERTYARDIEKLQEERVKIVEKLNLLSMDDSLEAKAERKKLNEDLAKLDEDIFEKRNAKEIKDRKDSLGKLIDDKADQIEKEEKIETDSHDKTIERIDKERAYWEKFYVDQLNDERAFAKMKEDIVAGNFDKLSQEFQDYIKEMEDTMPDLEDTLDGTMKAVGTSIRQNIIDALKEALELLNKVSVESGKGTVSPPSDSSLAGGGGGGPQSAKLNEGDLNVLTGKFYTERLALQESDAKRKARIKEKGHDLAAKGRSDGSTIRADQGLDQILADMGQAKREEFANHLLGSGSQHVSTPELQDFIKKFGSQLKGASMKLNTGGYVKKGAEGMVTLHEEEVVLNKPETSQFFKYAPILEKLSKLLTAPAMARMPDRKVARPDLVGMAESIHYDFDFNVDTMTGSESDADNFMKTINDKLKRDKGLR